MTIRDVVFRPLKAILLFFLELRLPSSVGLEKKYQDALKQDVSTLNQASLDPDLSSSYWIEVRGTLQRLIANEDPRRFLQWQSLRDTMTGTNPPYTGSYLRTLLARKTLKNEFVRALHSKRAIGGAIPYPLDPRTTADAIQRLYHIHILLEALGMAPNEFDYICEFGAGYGELCRCFYNMGFHGKYFIYDLPELLAIQKYYLSHFNLRVELPKIAVSDGQPSIVLNNTIPEFGQRIKAESGVGLFVATWSLSESPFELRKRIHEFIESNVAAVLIAAQPNFRGKYNNLEYFKDWLDPELFETRIQPVLGFTDNSFYLFARRRSGRDQPAYEASII